MKEDTTVFIEYQRIEASLWALMHDNKYSKEEKLALITKQLSNLEGFIGVLVQGNTNE